MYYCNISILYFHLFRKEFIFCIINILSSLSSYISLLFHSSSYSRYLVSIAVVETARGRIPSTNYNSRQVFCMTHGTFSFNITVCPFRLLQNSYKVCLCFERSAIRAADTFICSATNMNHLYKAHIYLTRGRWPFCKRGHRHARPFYARFSDTRTFPCFITFAITPLSGSPES